MDHFVYFFTWLFYWYKSFGVIHDSNRRTWQGDSQRSAKSNEEIYFLPCRYFYNRGIQTTCFLTFWRASSIRFLLKLTKIPFTSRFCDTQRYILFRFITCTSWIGGIMKMIFPKENNMNFISWNSKYDSTYSWVGLFYRSAPENLINSWFPL